MGARAMLALLGLATMLAGPASRAAPVDSAAQQQLLGVYNNAYNAALAAGKLPDALTQRSAAQRKALQKETRTAKARQEFLAMAKAMTPDRLQIVHSFQATGGDRARLVVLASKTFPPGKPVPGGPPPGSTATSELTLGFVREAGTWKLDDMLWGIDPAKVVACDPKFDGEAAFDGKDVSIGGPLARVDFQPDHTLLVVRVVDEETCAFLANRAEIKAHGLDPDTLTPYAMVEIEGVAHHTDKQKLLVEHLSVRPEE